MAWGVAGIHRRDSFAKEKREALELWADGLQGRMVQAAAQGERNTPAMVGPLASGPNSA